MFHFSCKAGAVLWALMGAMNVFVPVSEELMDRLGLSPDDLVPFELEYEILRPGEGFEVLEAPGEAAVSA